MTNKLVTRAITMSRFILRKSFPNQQDLIVNQPIEPIIKKEPFIEDCDNSSMHSDLEPPKKKRVRARLDHLSPGEKLQRRKMKNRIAAQTARDRKRAKIDHLEEENRKLREENEVLKSQLKMSTTSSVPALSVEMAESGVADIKSPETSMADCAEMDLLTVQKKSNDNDNSHSSRSSSTSGAYSSPPTPESHDYLDSMVDETNEATLIDDILQLQDTLFSGPGNEASIGSAELINVPQQKVQEASFQSLSVENSAGWTSIQLMLLLMISRVHRLNSSYSWRINCCATTRETISEHNPCVRNYSNLYDYIMQTKCIDFRRAAEAIISNKNNIREQKLIALDFVYIYVYDSRIDNIRKLIELERRQQ